MRTAWARSSRPWRPSGYWRPPVRSRRGRMSHRGAHGGPSAGSGWSSSVTVSASTRCGHTPRQHWFMQGMHTGQACNCARALPARRRQSPQAGVSAELTGAPECQVTFAYARLCHAHCMRARMIYELRILSTFSVSGGGNRTTARRLKAVTYVCRSRRNGPPRRSDRSIRT